MAGRSDYKYKAINVMYKKGQKTNTFIAGFGNDPVSLKRKTVGENESWNRKISPSRDNPFVVFKSVQKNPLYKGKKTSPYQDLKMEMRIEQKARGHFQSRKTNPARKMTALQAFFGGWKKL